jgi:hypothetical protein
MARKRSFLKNYMTNFLQIVPLFAASFSSVVADVKAAGDEGGKQ